MANPITWRNVGATVSAGDASRALTGAQYGIQRGFDAMGQALNKFQEGRQQGYQTGQQNLAANYLDRVAQARTPEEVEALRNDPSLAGLRSQLTGEFRNQVRGALDSRETGLMETIGRRQGFQDDQWTRNNQDALAGVERMVIDGNLEGALEQANTLGAPNAQQLVKDLFDSHTNVQGEQRAQNQDARAWNSDARAANSDRRAGESHDLAMGDRREADQLEFLVREEALRRRDPETRGGLTPEQENDAFREQLLRANFGVEEADAAVAQLETTLQNRLAPSVATQRELNAVEQDIEKTYFERNPYAVARKPAVQEAEEVLSGFREEGWKNLGAEAAQRFEISSQVTNALANGVEVVQGRGGDAQPVRIDVTPDMAKQVIQGLDPYSWDRIFEGDFNLALRKFVEENPSFIEEHARYREGNRRRAQAAFAAQERLPADLAR